MKNAQKRSTIFTSMFWQSIVKLNHKPTRSCKSKAEGTNEMKQTTQKSIMTSQHEVLGLKFYLALTAVGRLFSFCTLSKAIKVIVDDRVDDDDAAVASSYPLRNYQPRGCSWDASRWEVFISSKV